MRLETITLLLLALAACADSNGNKQWDGHDSLHSTLPAEFQAP